MVQESRDPLCAGQPAGQTGLEESGAHPILKALVVRAEQVSKLTPSPQLKVGSLRRVTSQCHIAVISSAPGQLFKTSAGQCQSEKSSQGPLRALVEVESAVPWASPWAGKGARASEPGWRQMETLGQPWVLGGSPSVPDSVRTYIPDHAIQDSASSAP